MYFFVSFGPRLHYFGNGLCTGCRFDLVPVRPLVFHAFQRRYRFRVLAVPRVGGIEMMPSNERSNYKHVDEDDTRDFYFERARSTLYNKTGVYHGRGLMASGATRVNKFSFSRRASSFQFDDALRTPRCLEIRIKIISPGFSVTVVAVRSHRKQKIAPGPLFSADKKCILVAVVHNATCNP